MPIQRILCVVGMLLAPSAVSAQQQTFTVSFTGGHPKPTPIATFHNGDRVDIVVLLKTIDQAEAAENEPLEITTSSGLTFTVHEYFQYRVFSFRATTDGTIEGSVDLENSDGGSPDETAEVTVVLNTTQRKYYSDEDKQHWTKLARNLGYGIASQVVLYRLCKTFVFLDPLAPAVCDFAVAAGGLTAGMLQQLYLGYALDPVDPNFMEIAKPVVCSMTVTSPPPSTVYLTWKTNKELQLAVATVIQTEMNRAQAAYGAGDRAWEQKHIVAINIYSKQLAALWAEEEALMPQIAASYEQVFHRPLDPNSFLTETVVKGQDVQLTQFMLLNGPWTADLSTGLQQLCATWEQMEMLRLMVATVNPLEVLPGNSYTANLQRPEMWAAMHALAASFQKGPFQPDDYVEPVPVVAPEPPPVVEPTVVEPPVLDEPPVVTECCGVAVTADRRYCPTCGWEARVQKHPSHGKQRARK